MSKKLMASVAAFLMIALLVAIPQAGISSPKPKVQAKRIRLPRPPRPHLRA